MDTERIYTETEKSILGKRRRKKKTQKLVFAVVNLSALADVCEATRSTQAALLYVAILANRVTTGSRDYVKLESSFSQAIRLDRAARSRGAKGLVGAGFIEIEKHDGCKLKYRLTKKGENGLVANRK